MTGIDLVPLDDDREYLRQKQWNCTVQKIEISNGHEIHIVFHGFALSDRYFPKTVDLLVKMLPGYPETKMDMFWTRPDVTLVEGKNKPQAADVTETHQGLSWQRWSRHFDQWRPDDRLENFMRVVINELCK